MPESQKLAAPLHFLDNARRDPLMDVFHWHVTCLCVSSTRHPAHPLKGEERKLRRLFPCKNTSTVKASPSSRLTTPYLFFIVKGGVSMNGKTSASLQTNLLTFPSDGFPSGSCTIVLGTFSPQNISSLFFSLLFSVLSDSSSLFKHVRRTIRCFGAR